MTTHYAPGYKPDQKPEPQIRLWPVRNDFVGIGRIVKRFFFFVTVVSFVLYIAAAVVSTINNAGWLSHHRDTDIALGRTVWMAGEFRTCHAQPTQDGQIYDLDCRYPGEDYGDGREHTLPVLFWGKIERSDVQRGSWTWKCQRKEDSVTCWAVD